MSTTTDLVREVGGFDEALSNLADYDLWIRLGLAASLAVVDRPLVGYRVHNSGMAHNVRRAEQELGYVEAKYRAVRRERGVDIRLYAAKRGSRAGSGVVW